MLSHPNLKRTPQNPPTEISFIPHTAAQHIALSVQPLLHFKADFSLYEAKLRVSTAFRRERIVILKHKHHR